MSDVFNVLIACEESQTVCKEFRKLGHRAFSCDIQVCSGGHPEWHILGDCLPLLDGRCTFTTMDGKIHQIAGKWDIIIAHPPCQYLTNAGNAHLSLPGRSEKRLEALEFFKSIYFCDCDHLCIENPPGYITEHFIAPTQTVHPYFFGDSILKRTSLWLRGLYPLVYTYHLKPDPVYVQVKSDGTLKNRYTTETFHGSVSRSKLSPYLAKAMAEQFTTTSFQYSFFD